MTLLAFGPAAQDGLIQLLELELARDRALTRPRLAGESTPF